MINDPVTNVEKAFENVYPSCADKYCAYMTKSLTNDNGSPIKSRSLPDEAGIVHIFFDKDLYWEQLVTRYIHELTNVVIGTIGYDSECRTYGDIYMKILSEYLSLEHEIRPSDFLTRKDKAN